MRMAFGRDTEDLPTPVLPERPRRQAALNYYLPYRFVSGVLTFLWPDGSSWLVTDQVEDRSEAVFAFCLRAFWSLGYSERAFAVGIWQTTGQNELPGTRTLLVTDEEMITLMLLEYSEGEARFRKHLRPILPAGECPFFQAFFPIAN